MITNQRIRPFIFAFLAFCVLSSKHIIIYNEETLVALSFALFVWFIFKYFSSNITESLDERSVNIKAELQNFLNLKGEFLKQLSREHQRVLSLEKVLKNVSLNTIDQIKKSASRCKESLYLELGGQIRNKLSALSVPNPLLQLSFEERIAQNLSLTVLVKKLLSKIQTEGKIKKRRIERKTIKRTIDLLVESSTK